MSNVCKCETPPGGLAICEPNQFALCHVRDGVAEMRCLNPPARGGENKAEWIQHTANWALSAIMGSDRSDDDVVSQQDLQILNSGRWENVAADDVVTVVTFSLPEKVRSSLPMLNRVSIARGIGA